MKENEIVVNRLTMGLEMEDYIVFYLEGMHIKDVMIIS